MFGVAIISLWGLGIITVIGLIFIVYFWIRDKKYLKLAFLLLPLVLILALWIYVNNNRDIYKREIYGQDHPVTSTR